MLQLRIAQRWAALTTAALVMAVLFIATTLARAQEVVVLVNGEPITQLDILQRTKLMQMSNPKPPARQEVIDLLIDETRASLGQIGAKTPAAARSVVIRHPGALAFPPA